MSARPSLRRISPYAERAHAARAAWERAAAVTGAPPPQMGWATLPRQTSLVLLQGGHGRQAWAAVLDLSQWVASTRPGLASLAPSVHRHERMLELFTASERPLDMPLPALAYDVLVASPLALSSGGDDTRYLTITTPQGRLWLQRFPEPERGSYAALSPWAREIPLRLSLSLGATPVRARRLAALRRGDVLLLARPLAHVISAGQVIARFSINQDGVIAMQEMDEFDMLPSQPEGDGLGASADVGKPGLAATGDIAVQVEFVLQRRTMNLAQLDALFQGQVMQLDPDAEKQVELVANGLCVARGELVELNGRIGIELHEVAAAAAMK